MLWHVAIQWTSFGLAQATIMNQGSYSHQSLNQQLPQVSETMQLLQLQLNEDTALQFTKSSIIFSLLRQRRLH